MNGEGPTLKLLKEKEYEYKSSVFYETGKRKVIGERSQRSTTY